MHLDWEKNLGKADRIIRAVIGLLLIGLVYAKVITGWWAIAAAVFGLFQLVEAYAAY